MSRLLARGATLVTAILVGAATDTAAAQGFSLSEVGSCAVARGFAVTGAVCNDASVIFWNPAAATRLPQGTTLTFGAAAIRINGAFRQDTTNRRFPSDPPTETPPHVFGTYTAGPWSAGLGVYVPYGLTSQWKENFPGRFVALKAALKTIYIQPSLAYAITPNWSVGIGPIYGYSNVELVQSIDLSEQVATLVGTTPITFGQLGIPRYAEFARAQLKGNGSAWGVNVGVHGKITPDWVVGARYLSELKFKYDDADVRFRQTSSGLTLAASNPITGTVTPVDSLVAPQFVAPGILVDQKGNSRITHPWQAQAGVGYTGLKGTTLSFDVVRVGWSSFNRLPLNFQGPASTNNRVLIEDYDNSWTFRGSAEHVLQDPGMWKDWALRGGFSVAQTPAPDETVTPLLPDMNRRNFSFGVGVPLRALHRGLTLDASYLYVGTSGRRGRITERTSESQTAAQLNSGAFALSAHVVSLSLNANF